MGKKEDALEKATRQIQGTLPIVPRDQVKSYGPLIQEFGIIIRNVGKDSDQAKAFLLRNPDFNELLQLVSILEHLRGAHFNIQFPQKPEEKENTVPIVQETVATL